MRHDSLPSVEKPVSFQGFVPSDRADPQITPGFRREQVHFIARTATAYFAFLATRGKRAALRPVGQTFLSA
ncbi:MAG: hypothetical protein WAU84_03340, partial [Thermoguttaceae bacterium]